MFPLALPILLLAQAPVPPMAPAAAMAQAAPAPKPQPVTAEPREVRPGESVLLTWACPGVPQIRLEPGGMVLPGKHQVTLRPAYTTTYRVFDVRLGMAELGQVEVRVIPGLPLGEPARICAFDASAKAVLPGDPVVLKWECAGSAKVRLEPGGLELDGKSEVTVTPLESTRYTITANNAAGGQSRTVEVAVLGRVAAATAPAPATVCTFEASRTVVKPGEQVDLRWICQGDAKVRLEPGGIELDGQSSIAVVPDKTTVYTLSVSNLLGGSSRSVEVRVEAPRRVLTEKDLVDPEEAAKPLDRMDLAEAFHRGETLRDAAPEGSWTVRLVVSGRADGLKQVARAAGSKAPDILVLPYARRDGLRFWQACFGTYSSRARALKAWRSAPEALRKAFQDALPQRLPASAPTPDSPTRE
jgi:septal ring-binding cell division protein DamX